MSVLEKVQFSVLDYSLFGLSLAFSIAIGFYHGCSKWLRCHSKSQAQQSINEELFAGGKLGVLPVAMSLVTTFLSAISLLGYPAEIYRFGTMFYYYGLMYFVAFPLAAIIFLPVFYKLKLPTVYSYLELRFDSKVKFVASTIFCLQTILYLSVGLYAPALTLNSVTDFPLVGSILITGSVCVIYTCIGGAKTVVYTNVYQFILIVVGLVAVVVTGLIHVGGFDNIWIRAKDGGRIIFDEFNTDPRIRHSFWSLMIGGTFTLLGLYCTNQMTVQRYISMRSLKEAQTALILNAPLNLLMITLYTITGLVLFATFYGCDPLKGGLVKKAEEILPYFVLHDLYHLKGLAGIFVSAIYGAGLSTVASGLNSLSAVLFTDFIKPFNFKLCNVSTSSMDEKKATLICKLLSLICGICIILLAFAFTYIQAPILQVALSLFGICSGPILGVFCLGLFFRRPNAIGALLGLLIGFGLTVWLGFSPFFIGQAPRPLPVSVKACNNSVSMNQSIESSSFPLINASFILNVAYSYSNTSDLNTEKNAQTTNYVEGIFGQLAGLSYQYYSLFGVVTVMCFGYAFTLLMDFCTSYKNRRLNDDEKMSTDLFVNWSSIFHSNELQEFQLVKGAP